MKEHPVTIFKNDRIIQGSKCISLDSWLSIIKEGIFNKNIIEEARNEVEINGKSKKYSDLKRKLPVVVYNSILDGNGRSSKNILSVSGFVYFDIDCNDKNKAIEIKNELTKNPYIYAVWFSISKLGIGCLVKSDLDINNFKSEYHEIANIVGLKNIDNACSNPTRLNYLTYDNEIYINNDSKKVTSGSNTTVNINTTTAKVLLLPDVTFLNENTEKISFDNESPYYLKPEYFKEPITELLLENYNETCEYFEEGKEFYNAYWPYQNVKLGGRNQALSCYANNILLLNPNCSLPLFTYWIISKNNALGDIKFSKDEIIEIVNYKWKNKENLIPQKVKIKKYWTDPKFNRKQAYQNCLKRVAKNKIINRFESYLAEALLNEIVTINSIKKNLKIKYDKAKELYEYYKIEINEYNMKKEPKSKTGIREFLDNYQESVKITQQLIADSLNVNVLTIKRNITDEQKQFIKNYNLNLKTK